MDKLIEFRENNEAIAVFEKMLLLDPNNMLAHMGLAKAFKDLEEVDISQAVAAVEHHQFLWEPIINNSRQEETNQVDD